MIKLPKPLATECVWYPNGADKPGVVGDCYTAEQMLQFENDVLEAVAKQIDFLANLVSNGNFLAIRERELCAKYIRSLKETNVITF